MPFSFTPLDCEPEIQCLLCFLVKSAVFKIMLVSLWMVSILLHFSSGCILSSTPEEVTGYTGGSVVLPCSCADVQTQRPRLRWIFNPGPNDSILVPYEKQHSRYKDKVQELNSDSPGNLSVLLLHLTKSDAGSYRCEANGKDHKDMKLSVKDGTGNAMASATSTVAAATTQPLEGFQSNIGKSQFIVYIIIAVVVIIATCVLFAAILIYCRTKCKKAADMDCRELTVVGSTGQEQNDTDSITYSAVVHPTMNKRERQITSDGPTEYAAIKLPS
ncbi:hypothetical protein JZ751_000787 [Albula glossodonta]|uniref:Ig-like domain-containing protein n=1 Tax=Albula glossodonta TaxID=121402 RepID=A0A8T2PX82_9TELE|nr:hypothetical protein JZ751_000787 [Albula glossodonta]